MALNSLIIVEEVAAAVEDRPAAMDLDRFRMMRRVAKDDVDPRAVDEGASKAALVRRKIVAPVRAPVQ